MKKAKLTMETKYRLVLDQALCIYKELRKERQAEGIAKAQAKGVKFGRKRKINRKKIVRLWHENTSAINIAQQMHISRSMVYKVLRENGVIFEKSATV